MPLVSGDWGGHRGRGAVRRHGTLRESCKNYQVCKLGGVKNPGSRKSTLDGVCDRVLGLDGSVVRH